MSTDVITILSNVLNYSGKTISVSAFAQPLALAKLVRFGCMVPAGIPSNVACKACADSHLVEVAVIDGLPRGICLRTGEEFLVASEAHYVDGDAFAKVLGRELKLDRDAKRVRGFDALWALGGRGFKDTRVVFFFAPNLDHVGLAASILDTLPKQSGAMTSCLIIASDRMDHVRLVNQRQKILSLRNVAQIDDRGCLLIDDEHLVRTILPDETNRKTVGRRPEQRDRILPILEELSSAGSEIPGLGLTEHEVPNETCRLVVAHYLGRYPQNPPPRNSTIRDAIMAWKTART